MFATLCTFNPLPTSLSEALRLSLLLFTQDATERKLLGDSLSKNCAIQGITALHSFLNTLLLTHDAPITGRLTQKVDCLLSGRNKAALDEAEKTLLGELEQVEEMLLNPVIVSPFTTNQPQGEVIDFDRTPVFKMVKGNNTFDPSYANITIGIVCLMLSRLTNAHLELNAVQIVRIFGVTMQTEDGFQDYIEKGKIKLLLEALEQLRESDVIEAVLYRGVRREWYALDFLKAHTD